ncbi:hypothetical protein Tco_0662888 [Tanacetum coccineum]
MVVTQNLNKFCEYHGGKGHNTNDCYQLKKQIEEVVASRKLARLVKDIRRNNQRNGNPGRNGVKKPRCQHPVKTQKMQDSDDRFFRGTYHPLGVIDLRVTLGKEGRSKTVLMEFAIIKCRSPNNTMSFAIQHHNGKDRNEKPQSNGFYHPLYDQIPH